MFFHFFVKHVSALCHDSVTQALDGTFSEENRANCAEATKPLTDAVESLTTFASNPEFASVPARISEEVGMGWPCYLPLK